MVRAFTTDDYFEIAVAVIDSRERLKGKETVVDFGKVLVAALEEKGYRIAAVEPPTDTEDIRHYLCRSCNKITVGRGVGRCHNCMSDDLVLLYAETGEEEKPSDQSGRTSGISR
jgi:hypothetical protein